MGKIFCVLIFNFLILNLISVNAKEQNIYCYKPSAWSTPSLYDRPVPFIQKESDVTNQTYRCLSPGWSWLPGSSAVEINKDLYLKLNRINESFLGKNRNAANDFKTPSGNFDRKKYDQFLIEWRTAMENGYKDDKDNNVITKRQSPSEIQRDKSPNAGNDRNRPQEIQRRSDNVKAGSGTGFFITNSGHIISNNHVVDQCNVVNAYYKGDAKPLKILAIDRKNDLVILKAELRPDDIFPVAKEDAILLEEIYVAGFPFGKSISGSIKVTKGVVSSLSGLGNNYSNLQIDASLQPGNSGGPILNKKGNVVGVAVAKLDYKKVIEAFNTIPENTNFGIKSSTLNQFLIANKVSSSSPKGSEMSIRDIGNKIEKATVYLDCWMTADKIQELKSKRVFFEE